MKKAVLFHGTDNSLEDNWYPWALEQLEANDFQMFAPELPENHTPNPVLYNNFLKQSGWDFTDNLLIGHSSGATSIINLLLEDWFPHVDKVVFVGVFLNEKIVKSASWYDPGQFDNLFPEHIDIEKLKQKCSRFVFIHGDNDPYCDYVDAKNFCEKLEGDFIAVKGGGHLTAGVGYTKLPQLLPILRSE